MGEGRLCWTLRRPFFYGVIVFIVCLIAFDVSFSEVFDGAFAHNSSFNLFYAYLFWSLPALIITIIISQLYAKSFGSDYPLIVSIFKFLFEDLVSPVYSIIQLIIGGIIAKMGGDVDWGGLIWDMIWTIMCGGFIAWGLLTQI